MRRLNFLILSLLILAARAQASTGMEVHFSPDKANDGVIVHFIDGAKKTLDVAAYSLTLPDVADAIIRAHKRGVKVRVFWDKAQSKIKHAQIGRLKTAGVPVKISPFSGLMHNKFLVVDGCKVELGSFNYTENAVLHNHENFLIFNDCSVGEKYEKYYEDMWGGIK